MAEKENNKIICENYNQKQKRKESYMINKYADQYFTNNGTISELHATKPRTY